MGCWLGWRCSLTQCHFLCRHDRLSCLAGTDQSGISQWRTREKFPSAHPTGTECSKGRGLCKGDCGLYSCATDLHYYGTIGHAWSGWGGYYHGLLEIWGLLQWTRCSGHPVLLLRLKDEDLVEAPDDSAFLQSLRISCSRVNGVYPPLALAEAFITDDDSTPRVRRLHLIVVDLNRRRRLSNKVSRYLSQVRADECATRCWNTLPIPWKQDQETYQLRYVFGYAMDGTDLPCYILWPIRTDDDSFWCIDAWKGDWVQLNKCGFLAPVGIEHFFDAFCFDPQRPWRPAASQALGIPSCHIAEDDHIMQLGRRQIPAYPGTNTS